MRAEVGGSALLGLPVAMSPPSPDPNRWLFSTAASLLIRFLIEGFQLCLDFFHSLGHRGIRDRQDRGRSGHEQERRSDHVE
jgi:hypothetical protein